MSANELRKAAELLRTRAEAATPGPWDFHVSEFTDLGGDVTGITDNGCSCDYNCNRTDPAYIAIMHPGVGLALADWLDATALRVEAGKPRHNGGRGNHSWRGSREALAVARLINGGAE